MVEGCGINCMKYLLLGFNLLFFLLGAVGVGIGIYVAVDQSSFFNLLTLIKLDIGGGADTASSTIRFGGYILIGGSCLVLIIAFLGCCGAWKEAKLLLCLYSFLMIVIFVLEIAAFIVALVFKGKFEDEIKKEWKKQLKEAYDKPTTDKNRAIIDAQNKLQNTTVCCGVDDPSMGRSCIEPKSKGCYYKIKDDIMKHFNLVIGVAIIIALVQLLLIVFSCCLYCRIGEEKIA